MDILFGNARFERGRPSGARVHIESLIRELHRLGHRVWTTPDSESTEGSPLPKTAVQRWRVLRNTDAIYLRFEGQPIRLHRRIYTELRIVARRKPVVWEINATPDYCALMWSAQGKDFDLHRLERQVRRQARRVALAICNTRGLQRYALDLRIPRTAVIPLGTDPSMFHPDVPCNQEIHSQCADLNIVWCGSPEIGWHDIELILSAAKCLQNDQRVKIFLVGKIDPIPGIPSNVHLLGEIQRDRLPSVLSCMDVGLALYREPSWSRFGVYSSPLKLFDYMAAGLVIIASPIEQVRAAVLEGQTGFLVPFGDCTALADRIKRIANASTTQRELIGQHAREKILCYYNWTRVAEHTASEIAMLL